MEFTYQDKQIYRKTNDTQYTGNPGNPASLSRPYLIAIEGGYGGVITFNYSQIPSTEEIGIWTRQAVTTKKYMMVMLAQWVTLRSTRMQVREHPRRWWSNVFW